MSDVDPATTSSRPSGDNSATELEQERLRHDDLPSCEDESLPVGSQSNQGFTQATAVHNALYSGRVGLTRGSARVRLLAHRPATREAAGDYAKIEAAINTVLARRSA